MALENEAGLPARLPLMAFRTTVNSAKSSTRHASDTMKARKTMNDAQRNPNWLDANAMIWAMKPRPAAMGCRINARDARSILELS